MQAGCSKIYITSRKSSACESACAALNALPNKHPDAVAIPVPADSAKISDIEALVKEVGKTTDHVDILLANAGATWGEGFDTHPDGAFAKVMDLNVKSVFGTVRLYVFAPFILNCLEDWGMGIMVWERGMGMGRNELTYVLWRTGSHLYCKKTQR